MYITFDGGSGTGKGTIIEWCRNYFSRNGNRTIVLRDNQLDPFRDCAALMLDWCKDTGINRNTFLFPLFAAGAKLAEAKVFEAIGQHDVVLRDRSFISSLAYTPSESFSQTEIWNLYVKYLGIRVPDVAVVVDADVETAMTRIKMREQNDIGLGGKMSGGYNHRLEIRRQFLTIPRVLGDQLNVLVVTNNGAYTERQDILNDSISRVARRVVNFCKKTEERRS